MEEKEPNTSEAETEIKVDSTLQTTENDPLVNQAPETQNKMDDSIPLNLINNSDQAKKNDSIKNIERLLDVEMNVTVRFGKTEIPLREAVNFGIGSMIELNRSVDEPVDLLVNNFPFARGEVVVIDGYYGVRVTEIGTPEERSHALLKNADN
jgi:flagellar motor switch protein FliN/FliY